MNEQIETEDPSPFMTPEETAEYLRLDPKNGARLLANWRVAGGDIGPPFRKHGKKVVYDVADVNAWSERQRRVSTSEKQQEATS